MTTITITDIATAIFSNIKEVILCGKDKEILKWIIESNLHAFHLTGVCTRGDDNGILNAVRVILLDYPYGDNTIVTKQDAIDFIDTLII